MKFLFTSARMLGYWDGKQHELSACNCYGLTWNETDIFYSRNPPDENVSFIEILGGSKLDFGELNNVHQILWYDGDLYITNTRRDSVVCQHWSLCLYTSSLVDNLHINSLFGYDGKLFVLESGLGGPCHRTAISILDGNQVIERIILDTNRIMLCHNLYLEDGIVYGCFKNDIEQQVGIFRKYLDSNHIDYVPVEDYSCFPRGLARDDKNFYIGISESLPRPERMYGNSRVLVLNDDLKLIDTIRLEETGQLCDIRLVTGDKAHNGLDIPYEKF